MSDAGSQTIRRGAVARSRPTVTRRATTRPPIKRPSSASRALATLPLPIARIKRALRWLVAIAILCGGLVLLDLVGVPQYVGEQIGEAAGRAGFVMRHVETRGLKHLDSLAVDEAAYDDPPPLNSLLLVDLGKVRQRLLRYGWVQDARVSRRLPDTLVVDVVERTPAAIWQINGHLNLIDENGAVLAPVSLDAMPDLPLVIGPDANRQVNALQALIAAAPGLKPTIAGGTWIGGRRWDVRFQSGEVLSLPEGDAPARQALLKFQGLDQNNRLLGQGYKHFDLRVPGKLIVRLSDEPGHEIKDPAPAADGAASPAPTPAPTPASAGTGDTHGTA